jgi:hypothetical protein
MSMVWRLAKRKLDIDFDALRQDVDDLKDRLEQALKHGDGERDRERYAY